MIDSLFSNFIKYIFSLDQLRPRFDAVLGRVCVNDELRQQVLDLVSDDSALPDSETCRRAIAKGKAAQAALHAAGEEGEIDAALAAQLSFDIKCGLTAEAVWRAGSLRSHIAGFLVDMGVMKMTYSERILTEDEKAEADAEAEAALEAELAEAQAHQQEEDESASGSRASAASGAAAKSSNKAMKADPGAASGTGPVSPASIGGASVGGGEGAGRARPRRNRWFDGSSVQVFLDHLLTDYSAYGQVLRRLASGIVTGLKGADDATGPLILGDRPGGQMTAASYGSKGVNMYGPRWRAARVEPNLGKTDVKAFFNRLLRLPLPAQNAVFAYYQVFFDATMRMMKANGELEQGLGKVTADAVVADTLAGGEERLISAAKKSRFALAQHRMQLKAALPPATPELLRFDCEPRYVGTPRPLWLQRENAGPVPALRDADRILLADCPRDLPAGLLLTYKETPLARQAIPGLHGSAALETSTIEMTIDRGMPLEVAALYYCLRLPTEEHCLTTWGGPISPEANKARRIYLADCERYYNCHVSFGSCDCNCVGSAGCVTA